MTIVFQQNTIKYIIKHTKIFIVKYDLSMRFFSVKIEEKQNSHQSKQKGAALNLNLQKNIPKRRRADRAINLVGSLHFFKRLRKLENISAFSF